MDKLLEAANPMTNANAIEPQDSAVKRALDHAEFVDRVPALQREAAEFATAIEGGLRFERMTEHGSLILKFPRHHLVAAYSRELADANTGRARNVDLRTARRRAKAARVNYEDRVNWRAVPDIEWSDGGMFVSLSAIIEARAEAVFWQKVVREMEYAKRIEQQNERARIRHRRESLGLAY